MQTNPNMQPLLGGRAEPMPGPAGRAGGRILERVNSSRLAEREKQGYDMVSFYPDSPIDNIVGSEQTI